MMRPTRRARILAVLLILALSYSAGSAYAGLLSSWARYRQTNDAARVQVVRIRPSCIDHEDSASHLKLIRYGNGRAVYGCYHKGY